MLPKLYYYLLLLISTSCHPKTEHEVNIMVEAETAINHPVQAQSSTIKERIEPPEGYERSYEVKNSFQEYLRNLPLKSRGTKVRYYDGTIKSADQVYLDVVDLKIGDKNLHQCADAIMRLRGEYLWYQKAYDKIHFNFTNGFSVDYTEWMKGRRMVIEGNKTYWNNSDNPSNNYEDFWDYMELIFMYAGTASLEKELVKINIHQAEIGDVLIKGGFPGHAVIIVDKAINDKNGDSVFILAQSYMPAQEIQILKNPRSSELSPWFELEEGTIYTPEWTFTSNDLKRFQD